MKSVLTIMLLLAIQPVLAGDLYRWVDKAGNVHYGDVPPNDAQQLQQKTFGMPASAVSGDAALPFQTRQAKQRFPVTLYVTDSCKEPCRQARDFLNQRHIPFTEKDLATQDEINAFKKQSGSDGIPTLSIGTDWLKGFQAQGWGIALDAAGYPK